MNWINVEDRLPEGRNQWNTCWWMINQETWIPTDACYINGKWLKNGKEIHNVTHWMPLPDPPEEE